MPKQKKSTPLRFNKTNLAKLKPCPVGQQKLYHDSSREGLLRIKCTSQGCSYIHQASTKVNLGSIHEISLEDAYARSDELRALAKKGLPAKKATFGKSIIDFLEDRALEAQSTEKLRPATIKTYLDLVKQARTHQWQIASIPVDKLTEDHCRAWFEERNQQSPVGASTQCTILKFTYKQLTISRQIPRENLNPFQIISDLGLLNSNAVGKAPASTAELPAILQGLTKLHYKFPNECFTFAFLLHTGLRPDTLWNLKLEDFDKEAGMITIRQSKTQDKPTTLPVSDYVTKLLTAKALNPTESGHFVEKWHTQYFVKKLEKLAGRNFRLKDCRSTYSSIAIALLDIDEWKVNTLQLRQSTNVLMRNYVNADPEKLRLAANKISEHINLQGMFSGLMLEHLKLDP